MKNKDLYLDEYGQYHEVEEELEDHELDLFEDEEEHLFESSELDSEFDDEDEDYLSESNSRYDSVYESESDENE